MIREELFNVNFEENGRELVQKFRLNFQRLKEFMQNSHMFRSFSG